MHFYIVIDGDTYRAQHPYFRELQEKYGVDSVDYTKVFAGKMVEAVIDKLSSLKYNLIIEGTLRSAAVPINTATLLKSKGYTVDFCLIATKPELSYLTTQLRYLEMMIVDPFQARATPKDHHDGIVKSLVSNINELEQSGLFESIQVYKRDLEQVYNSKLCTESVGTVVDQILFGAWTQNQGHGYYKDEIAVQDRNLITASSAGSLLWAKFIVEELGLYSKTTVEAWFNYFSTGDPQYYGEMMNSLEKDALES